jgi:D-alanyl-D-alanine carboxypeptidase
MVINLYKEYKKYWLFYSLIVIFLLISSCTLNISTHYEPPPETWDPALNTHPDGAAFQKLLKQYVNKGLPGVVLFVRTPDGQWNGAAGYAKIETGDKMYPMCRFFAQSITKMYIATSILILKDNGLIDLDTSIDKYLSKKIYKYIQNNSKISVRHLLNHNSGISDFSASLSYEFDTLNNPMVKLSPERLLSYIEEQFPIFSPGKGYFYSNANYLLLALILNEVNSFSHSKMISNRILRPYGLSTTYYHNEKVHPEPPGLVNSYQDLTGDGRIQNVSDITIHNADNAKGYAGLIATSVDFADFIDALFSAQIITSASLDEMQKKSECDCYGLGLSLNKTKYGPSIGHGGEDIGSRSEVRRFVDLDATIVLLINAGESGNIGKLYNKLWEKVVQTALEDL